MIALLFPLLAWGLPEESVKFQPSILVYECPLNFVYKSDCTASSTKLPTQKLVLSIQALERRMGSWSYKLEAPVPANFFVIVLRSRDWKSTEYSVSTEAGLAGSPVPFANSRVVISDATVPSSFGVSTAPVEKDGKKYMFELRLTDFHGKVRPLRK